jgi:hypothetical protein
MRCSQGIPTIGIAIVIIGYKTNKIYVMKTQNTLQTYIGTYGFLVLSAIFLSSCSDKGREQTQKSLTEFKIYVKEHKEAADKYAEEKWEDIEKEYEDKKADLDKNVQDMDKEMKQSYANAVADWEEFKNDLDSRAKAKQQEKKATELKHTFAPDYIKTDMSNISGKNIVIVYTHFFNVIEKNKEVYTKEEWVIANDYWNTLNDIRDRLDEQKAISKEDNRDINEIRIKYGATKALNKPFAEGAK